MSSASVSTSSGIPAVTLAEESHLSPRVWYQWLLKLQRNLEDPRYREFLSEQVKAGRDKLLEILRPLVAAAQEVIDAEFHKTMVMSLDDDASSVGTATPQAAQQPGFV